MKKRNKVIQFIKDNWYFVLLLIPFIVCCFQNRKPDNDIWFLMNNGRYVLNHGFTNIDPFTVHEGFHYIMQQWLSSVIFYSMFYLFGKYGLLIIVLVFLLLLTIVLYKTCYYVSKDKVKSVIITALMLSIARDFFVTRPQIISFIILLLETLCLEKYIKTNNWKNLIALPFLSVLLINCNCAIWFMQFVFVLPFLVDIVITKKKKKRMIKDIVIVLLIMLLVGFINPYGLDAITYLFRSYGIKELNGNIVEMYYSVMNYDTWICSNILLFIYLFIGIHLCKKKNDIRFTLFVIGTFFLASIHRKCIIYFLLWGGYAFASLNIDFNIKGKLKKIIKSKWFIYTKNVLFIGGFISLIVSFLIIFGNTIKKYSMKNNNDYIVNYILNNYDSKKVRLFTSYDEGGYTEFKGLKSYIDPRAELFVSKLNGKYDVFSEFGTIINYPDDEFIDSFLSKYNFTHIMVEADSIFEQYLDEDKDYVCELNCYYDENRDFPYKVLYVKKDISIKDNKKQN